MFDNITVKAGQHALDLINDGAFDPSHIQTIPAASGGPKFLVLTGIDRAVFSHWLSNNSEPINWISSSIGSWRGAALAQSSPIDALDKLEDAYIHQQFSCKPSAQEISNVAWSILNSYLGEEEIQYILNSSRIKLHIFTARSKGLGKTDLPPLLGLHLLGTMGSNILSRRLTGLFFGRSIYSSDRTLPSCIADLEDFSTQHCALTHSNFRRVIMASGSIPMAMSRIEMEDSTILRDGGLTDYHFDLPFASNEGITLYPHYTDTIRPGWFDKHLSWRTANKDNHANTILVSPSTSFIECLPNGKVPDRKDFAHYKGRDRDRFTDWARVVKRSQVLGEELLEAFESGGIKKIVTPL